MNRLRLEKEEQQLVLLRRLCEDGREQRLFVRPRRRHTGGPVCPIGRFADGVGVRDEWLTFIRVLEHVRQVISTQ